MKRAVQLVAGSVVIFLIIFVVYTPVLENGFVNWDDDRCIYENIHIQSLDIQSLHWMFTAFHAGNWHPLTWLSHALVYNRWGLNPRVHHLINIILHSLNAVLVFLLVTRLLLVRRTNARAEVPVPKEVITGTRDLMVGGITALLFGLHPLNVESVAWVTERKGLLCSFFVFFKSFIIPTVRFNKPSEKPSTLVLYKLFTLPFCPHVKAHGYNTSHHLPAPGCLSAGTYRMGCAKKFYGIR